jgi:hypothetical protein
MGFYFKTKCMFIAFKVNFETYNQGSFIYKNSN